MARDTSLDNLLERAPAEDPELAYSNDSGTRGGRDTSLDDMLEAPTNNPFTGFPSTYGQYQLDLSMRDNQLRDITPREAADAQLIRLDTNKKKEILRAHGINPNSLDKIQGAAVPGGAARFAGALTGAKIGATGGASLGTAIGTVGGPGTMAAGGLIGGVGGGALGGAAGFMAPDLVMLARARSIAGTKRDTFGLDDMVQAATPGFEATGEEFKEGTTPVASIEPEPGFTGQYLRSGATEGAVTGMFEGALGPTAMPAYKELAKKGVPMVSRNLNKLYRTPVGQQVAKVMTPAVNVLKPIAMKTQDFTKRIMQKPAAMRAAVDRFIWRNITRGPKKIKDMANQYGWHQLAHGLDDDVLRAKAMRESNRPFSYLKDLGDDAADDMVNRMYTPAQKELALGSPDDYRLYLKDLIDNEVFPMVEGRTAELGARVRDAKINSGLFTGKVQFNFNKPIDIGGEILDLDSFVDDIVQSFPDILPNQQQTLEGATLAIKGHKPLLNAFNLGDMDEVGKIMGKIKADSVRLAKKAAKQAAKTGNPTPLADPNVMFKKIIGPSGPVTYKDLNTVINVTDEALSNAYKMKEVVNLERLKMVDAYMLQFRKFTNKAVHARFPHLATNADDFTQHMITYNKFKKYVGDDPSRALDFVSNHLLADPVGSNPYGQEAFKAMFQGMGSKLIKLERAAAGAWLHGNDILTTGVKTYLPPLAGKLVGGAIGGTIGGVAGYKQGGKKGAAIGFGLGTLATASQMTPAMAAGSRALLAKMGRGKAIAGLGVRKGLNQISKELIKENSYSRALMQMLTSKPIGGAIESYMSKFDTEITQEDLDQLKRVRTEKLITQ